MICGQSLNVLVMVKDVAIALCLQIQKWYRATERLIVRTMYKAARAAKVILGNLGGPPPQGGEGGLINLKQKVQCQIVLSNRG